MHANPFVFDATLENFQSDVVEASMQVPVVIDFWADWCQPCQVLMPLLEKLAQEYKGAFRLAKVNADAQPQLAAHLGVRSLPTVKIVKGGRLVDEFTGALPESRIRAVLDKHVEKPAESLHDQGKRLWAEGDLEGALVALIQANQDDPKNVAVLIDVAQIKAQLGELDEAREILNSLSPEDRLNAHARQLIARLKFLEQAGQLPPLAEIEARLASEPSDLAAQRTLALHRVLAGQNAEAMALLVGILQVDRHHDEGATRKVLIELFDMLGNTDPDVKQFRRKLYTLLY